MKTYKKYTIFQSYKVVALKLSLPCPFECKNSKGRGTHNFWATTLKLWKNEYFLRVFKSYYYHFFIFLLDSDLEKTLLSQTSIAWGVLDLTHSKQLLSVTVCDSAAVSRIIVLQTLLNYIFYIQQNSSGPFRWIIPDLL